MTQVVMQSVYWFINVLIDILIGSAVLDMVRGFAPRYQPRGWLLAFFGIIYTVSDLLLKPVRKIVRPIRLGPVMIDLAWMITMAILVIVQSELMNVIYAIFHNIG